MPARYRSAGTSLEWQIRTAATQAGLGLAIWVGPSGDNGSYFAIPGELIHDSSNGQWIQYKAYLYSDSINTPIISDVTIDYET